MLGAGFIDRPIAHRALHGEGRIENSTSAIKAAIEHGYGIELDLQPALGGTPMVFHDAHLGRLTGLSGQISQTSEEVLRETPLSGSTDLIPTLRDVLALVAGRVPLLLEVKDQDGLLGPSDGQFEKAIASELSGYSGDLAVMSFNPHSIIWMKDLLPEVSRGIVTCDYSASYWKGLPTERRGRLSRIADLQEAQASFISHRHTDLAAARPVELRAAGVPVLCWTITSPAEEQAARRYCDNITFEQYLPSL